MTASDLNKYLAEVSARPVTAKDFRTNYASATALDQLSQIEQVDSPAACRRAIAEIAWIISADLGNTAVITPKSYIHPRIIEKFGNGELTGVCNSRPRAGLTVAESKLMRFLEANAHFKQ